jgi:hypothetical protein
MMVTYKAANEIDWFRSEKETSKKRPRSCLGIPFIVSNPSRISNCRYHLARLLALSGERQKILFKDNQKRQEEPQIPGKSVGRILPDHRWPLLT